MGSESSWELVFRYLMVRIRKEERFAVKMMREKHLITRRGSMRMRVKISWKRYQTKKTATKRKKKSRTKRQTMQIRTQTTHKVPEKIQTNSTTITQTILTTQKKKRQRSLPKTVTA